VTSAVRPGRQANDDSWDTLGVTGTAGAGYGPQGTRGSTVQQASAGGLHEESGGLKGFDVSPERPAADACRLAEAVFSERAAEVPLAVRKITGIRDRLEQRPRAQAELRVRRAFEDPDGQGVLKSLRLEAWCCFHRVTSTPQDPADDGGHDGNPEDQAHAADAEYGNDGGQERGVVAAPLPAHYRRNGLRILGDQIGSAGI